MKVSGRTSSVLQYSCRMPKIMNIGQGRNTTHATEATPTSLYSRYSLIVSDLSTHVQSFCLAFFCSASTQTVLTRTVGITEYKGQLRLKRSNATRLIKTTLPRPTQAYRPQNSFSRRYSRRARRRKATLPRSHFTVTPTSASHVSFTLRLREIQIPCLNRPGAASLKVKGLLYSCLLIARLLSGSQTPN